jgi:hypothetical protein
MIVGEAMSQGDFNRNKTYCLRGHELTPENIYTIPSTGSRQCRTCRDARKQEWQRVKLYGLDNEGKTALLASQGNACDICGRTDLTDGKGFNDVWHTDHEHDKPGTHRGILCATCNTALGKLEPHIIKVIQYLVKYNKTELIEFLRNLTDGNLNSTNQRHDGVGQEV